MTTPSEKPKPQLSSLILSIGSEAAMQMGLTPHPQTNKIEKNLELAQFNIDLLLTIKEKTKNNLNKEEDTLLAQIISDLQRNFLEAQK